MAVGVQVETQVGPIQEAAVDGIQETVDGIQETVDGIAVGNHSPPKNFKLNCQSVVKQS